MKLLFMVQCALAGRCLFSQYLVNRDANRGECAQPCRWGYHLMEEKRENEFYPILNTKREAIFLMLRICA